VAGPFTGDNLPVIEVVTEQLGAVVSGGVRSGSEVPPLVRSAPQPAVDVLTPRQREVAHLIALGYTNIEIAQELVLETGTAANHVAQILTRLGLRNRAQVAAWATAIALPAARHPRAEPLEPKPLHQRARMATVLVVEDDLPLRTVLADVLADDGYEVLQTCDGRAALELAEHALPHVILMDLQLRGGTGTDVLAHLRQSNTTCHIPVIVVSGLPEPVWAAPEVEPTGFISKPFDVPALLELLALITESGKTR